jgi:hypothetical protein
MPAASAAAVVDDRAAALLPPDKGQILRVEPSILILHQHLPAGGPTPSESGNQPSHVHAHAHATHTASWPSSSVSAPAPPPLPAQKPAPHSPSHGKPQPAAAGEHGAVRPCHGSRAQSQGIGGAERIASPGRRWLLTSPAQRSPPPPSSSLHTPRHHPEHPPPQLRHAIVPGTAMQVRQIDFSVGCPAHRRD